MPKRLTVRRDSQYRQGKPPMPYTLKLTRAELDELLRLREEAVVSFPRLAAHFTLSSAAGKYIPLLLDAANYLMGVGGGNEIEYIGPKYATERRDELLNGDAPPGLLKAVDEYAAKFGLQFNEALLHYAHVVERCPMSFEVGSESIFIGRERTEWLEARRG